MNNKYFELARNEERSGNDAAALLLYLSSFCDSCNHGTKEPLLRCRSKDPAPAAPAYAH